MAPRKFDKNILSEDGIVKFDFMTSLQNIVMAKIVNYLWMDKSRLQDIVECIHSGITPKGEKSSLPWGKIESRIDDKIFQLPIPESMTKKLRNVLDVIGDCMLKWIRYHECILNTNKYLAVDQLLNISWTARGKIDYAQTARNILADKDSRLCDDDKYKLACTYCLDGQIAVLAPRVVNENYLDSVQIERHPMVYFWTAHITGDSTKLCNHYRDYIMLNNVSINEYILQLSINNDKKSCRTFNEVPLRYMWGLLSKEEKAKNISSLIEVLSNQELKYTLLSSLDFVLQQEVFKECSNAILSDLFNDWLWEEYFLPTALHILDIIQPLSYSFMLNLVYKKIPMHNYKPNYKIYMYMFKELWMGASRDLKDFILRSNNPHIFFNFFFKLIADRDMDLTGLILNNLNAKQKHSLMFWYGGSQCCANLIMKDEWDLLEKFINFTFSSEQDINLLKEEMIRCTGAEIAKHFLKNKEYGKIENFMCWASKSEEKINTFRKSLAFITCESELNSVYFNNNVDFTNLENHFKWCAGGDVEVLNQFKAEVLEFVSESYSSFDLIYILIEEDKYELLDQFLSWCFLNNPITISEYKNGIHLDFPTNLFRSLALILIKRDSSLKMLDKFVDWSFTNHQDIQEFKAWLLYPLEESSDLFIRLLLEDKSELADKFLEWCVTSSEEIAKYKNLLMLSRDFISTFEYDYNEEEYPPSVVKWFNPSKELVAAFKKKIPSKYRPKYFYKLLDNFLDDHNGLFEINNENSGPMDLT